MKLSSIKRVGGGLKRFDGVVDRRAKIAPAVFADGVDIFGRQQVGDFEMGIVGIGVEHEGIERFPQIARALAVRQVAAGGADRPRDQNVRRHVAARAFELREDAAVMRMFNSAGKESTRLHHLMAGVVNGGRGVINGADERNLVHDFGKARKDLAHGHAGDFGGDRLERSANFGRGVGLHVPGVKLGRPADQKEKDTIDVAIFFDRSLSLQILKRGQSEAECCQRAGVEKVATGETVAKAYRFFGVDSKHRE